MSQGTILVVEDSGAQRSVLEGFLRKKGYRVLGAGSAKDALERCAGEEVELLLTDLRLGGQDGISLFREMRGLLPALQAIVLTAYGTVEDAIAAMKLGAYDFVSKPVDLDRLETLVEKALEKGRLEGENRTLAAVVGNTDAFSGVIGASESMAKLVQLASRAAASRASVLILGESGTGKEVLARAIHLASPRRHRPLLTVSCAALPDTLIESELFGHEAGSFTGAAGRRKGRFELADGGTLFLDEIGEVPLHVQVKLLNVLQSGAFERIGGTETVRSDVRIIAATNRDLEERVKEGHFREDLFYRLNVIRLTIPPLRQRKEDIPALAGHFLRKYTGLNGVRIDGFDDGAMARLLAYDFPGNIRELENWIERAVVLAEGDVLRAQDLPELENAPVVDDGPEGLDGVVESLEKRMISEALGACGGNQSAAARRLKISERAIRYKMKKYGL